MKTKGFALKGLIKSTADKSKPGRFVGIASTDSLDMQGEIVDPDGLDWSYAIQRGFLVDTHDDSTSERAVGIIEKVERKGDQWLIYGFFMDTPRARRIWPVIVEAAKNQHFLGLSIEGIPREKEDHVIKRADIVNVAITPNPVNPDTKIEPLMKSLDVAIKSLETGNGPPADYSYGNGAALLKQEMAGGIAIATDKQKEAGMQTQGKEGLAAFVDALSDEDRAALLSLLQNPGASKTPAAEEQTAAPETAENVEEPPKDKVDDFDAAFEKAMADDFEDEGNEDVEEDEGAGEEPDEGDVDVDKGIEDVMAAPANGDGVSEVKLDGDTEVDITEALNGLVSGLERRLASVESAVLKLAETTKGISATVKKSAQEVKDFKTLAADIQKGLDGMPIQKGMAAPKSVQANNTIPLNKDVSSVYKERYGTEWTHVLSMKLQKALNLAAAKGDGVAVDEIGNALMNMNHGEYPTRAFLLKHDIED